MHNCYNAPRPLQVRGSGMLVWKGKTWGIMEYTRRGYHQKEKNKENREEGNWFSYSIETLVVHQLIRRVLGSALSRRGYDAMIA